MQGFSLQTTLSKLKGTALGKGLLFFFAFQASNFEPVASNLKPWASNLKLGWGVMGSSLTPARSNLTLDLAFSQPVLLYSALLLSSVRLGQCSRKQRERAKGTAFSPKIALFLRSRALRARKLFLLFLNF